MATGTTNPMMTQTGATAIPEHNHQLNEITGLSEHLDKIQATEGLLSSVTTLLATCDNLLSAANYASKEEVVLLEQYTADLQEIQNKLNEIVLEDPEDEITSLKEAVTELQGKLNSAYDAANAVMALYQAAEGNTAGELQKLNDAIVSINTTLAELSTGGTDMTTAVEALDARILITEGDILNLKGADTTQAAEITRINAIVTEYLPSSESDGKLKEDLDAVAPKVPTALNIIKVEDLPTEEPESGESDPQGESTEVTEPEVPEEVVEPIDDELYLDYNLSFVNNVAEEQFSSDLALTADIKNYLNSAFKRFVENYLKSRLMDTDTRLSKIRGCLDNLVQHVACLESHHNFIIKDIALYFADGDTGIGSLPAATTDLLKVDTTFPDVARIDNKIFAPSELEGRYFYVVFETSYPIDLADNKVSLGFDGTYLNAPGRFKCSRLGIPDISNAMYVLHATVDGDATSLTPFQFGNSNHVFGQLFTQKGTYEFMLKVTDPYNPNVNAVKSKQLTVGYPIYYGISENESITSEQELDKTLLHTKLNSPATTIDWTAYNTNRTEPIYYYYIVPSALLENKTLQFSTGYGPGGWEALSNTIEIENVTYNLYRTTYKLTFCPLTVVTDINLL